MTQKCSKIFFYSVVLGIFVYNIFDLIDPLVPVKKSLVMVEKLPEKESDRYHHVLNFVGLVNRYAGYQASEYAVTTEDGYVLKIHRMWRTNTTGSEKNRPVIFIQHGWLMSSESFVLRGPGKDLSFLLAEAGYDVWLGNLRGNAYSQQLNGQSSPYDFSYHEHGLQDLKAMIDFVLEETKQKQLAYVGYSMGTTIGYVLLSQQPVYNEKFRIFYNLSPIVFWDKDCKVLGQLLLNIYYPMKKLYDLFGLEEVSPRSAFIPRLAESHCTRNATFQKLCQTVSIFFLALNEEGLDIDLLPEFWAHYPMSSSINVMSHFSQNYETGEFRALDYGCDDENFKRYGTLEPPIYDLSKVSTRISIWYSVGDQLVNQKDIGRLADRLSNVLSVKVVEDVDFNHGDFIRSGKARDLVYKQLLEEDTLDLARNTEFQDFATLKKRQTNINTLDT